MSNDSTFKIDRRQFVIVGSTGLIGFSLVGPTMFAEGLPVQGSIGYWSGSERLPDLSVCRSGKLDDVWFDVIPATMIPQSDPRFIDTGMRVSVWSMGGDEALGGIRSVVLTSEVRADDIGQGKMLPFHVWSLERAPVRKESSPVGFNATVEFGRPVDLLLSLGTATRTRGVRQAATPAPDVRFRFSLEDGLDARITRGVYFLGFGPDPIDWERIEYNALVEGEGRQLLERRLSSVRPVSFPHFVVAIDHGTFNENGV